MLRFAPYVEISIVLILGALIAVIFSGSVVVKGVPRIASPTAVSTSSPSLPTASTMPPKESIVSTLVPEGSPLDASAIVLRKALVNIICHVREGSKLYSISGSGVIIDPKGFILTNAHVGQYFLLADRGVSCTIRAGGPVADAYNASLAYISPAWLEANADVLTQANPVGTGEHDFAFLAITTSATSTPLPASFSYVPLATESPKIGTSVAIASYGSQSLKFSQVQSALFPIVVFGSVKDVFTFATTSIDILALGGSVAAQGGSSGGGVVSASGKLVGTITTSRVKGDISTRALNAITAPYIRAEYLNETGQTLGSLLAKSPSAAAAAFAPQMPALEAILTANLP